MKCNCKILLVVIAALGLAACGGGTSGEGCCPCGVDADCLAFGSNQVCSDAGRCIAAWDPRFDDFAAALEADLRNSTAYGVSVAVLEGGQLTFAQAFGSKDPVGSIPLTPETLMQIGSTTKQMTAVALLRKVEAGLVGLDDSLEQTLPELEFARDATWDDQLTLHQLLTHQGAFYDFIPWDGSAADRALADWTYATFATETFLMNPPGIFFNYSNPNFVLAGLITEVLDDRAWPDILREDVFGPLGMHRTFLRKAEVQADGDYALSFGLGFDDLVTGTMGPVEMADLPDAGWVRPAGLAWTTPSQMMLWAGFLMDGDPDVLSDALRAEITTAHVSLRVPSGDRYYGYGEFVHTGYLAKDGSWYRTPVWEHGGNTLSFSHLFYVLPELDFAVAICASGLGVDFTTSMDTALTTLADLPAPSPAPVYGFDPDQLDRHVGDYLDAYNFGRMIITRQDDSLRIELPEVTAGGYQVAPALVAVSSDYFILTVEDVQFDLTFIPLAPGGDSQFVRNRLFVTTRVDRRARSAWPKPSRESIGRLLRRARLDPRPWMVLPRAPR
jgi:CubicO group peptidase (beta-lactamase class C family)